METSPTFEAPQSGDGAELWRLAGESGLDVNSPYAYLLMGRDFARSSVVVRDGARVVAFIFGYRRPDADDTLFVWQVAVAASHRRRGLALKMLQHLAERLQPDGVRWVEATVTPSNEASLGFFRSFAREHGAVCEETDLFTADAFPSELSHEEERLLRIGPGTANAGD